MARSAMRLMDGTMRWMDPVVVGLGNLRKLSSAGSWVVWPCVCHVCAAWLPIYDAPCSQHAIAPEFACQKKGFRVRLFPPGANQRGISESDPRESA